MWVGSRGPTTTHVFTYGPQSFSVITRDWSGLGDGLRGGLPMLDLNADAFRFHEIDCATVALVDPAVPDNDRARKAHSHPTPPMAIRR
jgi:hypothetical protein